MADFEAIGFISKKKTAMPKGTYWHCQCGKNVLQHKDFCVCGSSKPDYIPPGSMKDDSKIVYA